MGQHNWPILLLVLDALAGTWAHLYIFTPKGKVIDLVAGSTPVDFAYRIHTRVGDTTTGALVNGVMVPLNTVLKTGDMVEIKTNKNSIGPSEGWLEFVKSNLAKSQIKKFLAKKNAELLREEKINKGRISCQGPRHLHRIPRLSEAPREGP